MTRLTHAIKSRARRLLLLRRLQAVAAGAPSGRSKLSVVVPSTEKTSDQSAYRSRSRSKRLAAQGKMASIPPRSRSASRRRFRWRRVCGR